MAKAALPDSRRRLDVTKEQNAKLKELKKETKKAEIRQGKK